MPHQNVVIRPSLFITFHACAHAEFLTKDGHRDGWVMCKIGMTDSYGLYVYGAYTYGAYSYDVYSYRLFVCEIGMHCSYGVYIYDLNSYGLCRYVLCSYGVYSYCLYVCACV